MPARPASPLDTLKPLAGRALQTALNRLLALDPDTLAALRGLEGRRIEVALEAPALALAVTVADGALRVGPAQSAGSEGAAEPDLAVRGRLGGFLAQVPWLREAASRPPPGRLRISGDAELAQRVQKLAAGFDPDWERPFAEVFGEVPGPALAKALRAGLRGGAQTARGLARDAAEFLTEEAREVASKTDLERFGEDVDTLRDDVERLAARVTRLTARLVETSE